MMIFLDQKYSEGVSSLNFLFSPLVFREWLLMQESKKEKCIRWWDEDFLVLEFQASFYIITFSELKYGSSGKKPVSFDETEAQALTKWVMQQWLYDHNRSTELIDLVGIFRKNIS